jgi:nitroreductase
MSEHRINTEAEIDDLLAKRWSPRAYDTDQAVDGSTLTACLEAARWAPSCFGDEPWRFLVCNRSNDEAAWQKLLNCLAPKNQQWASHAPVLILTCADSLFGQNGKPNRWGQYDMGAAAVSLCLQATALGLITHQMGGFDTESTREAFAIPERFTPMSIIAIGYKGDYTSLDEGFQGSEAADRSRKNMHDIVFRAAWGPS